MQPIKKYKEDHPDYPKEIREACAAETRQLYEEYLKKQKKAKRKKLNPKSLLLKIEESKTEKSSAQN